MVRTALGALFVSMLVACNGYSSVVSRTAAPTCSDQLKNGSETDVDCGGGACAACADGKACLAARDCTGGSCIGNVCAAASTCTDAGCGGTCAARCAPGKHCVADVDCASAVCTAGLCAAPSCNDGVKNGGESDIDCGGSCPACVPGKTCGLAADCQSAVCVAEPGCTGSRCPNECAAATCADGVKNGSETGVDCGGPACLALVPPQKCADGQGCRDDADCAGRVCDAATSTCKTPVLSLLAGRLGGSGYADGAGAAARFSNPEGVVADGAGNLFVADQGNGVIRKIVIATGAVSTLAGAPRQGGCSDGTGADARFGCPQQMAGDGYGNLFLADGCSNSVRQIVIATGAVTTLAGSCNPGSSDGIGAAASFNGPVGIAADGIGNLFVADQNNQTIRKVAVATGLVTTLAGSPGQGGTADGNGAAARFNQPASLAVAGGGTLLFVADWQSYTVRRIVLSTGDVTTWDTTAGPTWWGFTDGTASGGPMGNPMGLAADASGHLFVSDSWPNFIRKIDVATGALHVLAGALHQPGTSDGTGAGARFGWPQALGADGAGNVFVSDTQSATIRQITAAGVVTTLAGTPGLQQGYTDGPGADARFTQPQSLAAVGNSLFVADQQNNVIREIALDTGQVSTLAGGGSGGSTDGTGAGAEFSNPWGVAADGAGHLFVADTYNHTIRKVDLASGAVTTIAGTAGSFGFVDGDARTAARFDQPMGLATDGVDLYIADWQNCAVRRLALATGAVTTLAGTGQWGNMNGIGTAAGFSHFGGLTLDGAGNLFVADTGTNTVRKIVLATRVVTTQAGSLNPPINGSADGIGADARFSWPTGIAADGAGHLYVSDTNNSTLRKITLATGEVTTLVGTPNQAYVRLGGISAGLNSPAGVAVLPGGGLAISDTAEASVLLLR